MNNLDSNFAFDINSRGWIVGESDAIVIDDKASLSHAVLWTPAGDGSYIPRDLGVPSGFTQSSADGLSEPCPFGKPVLSQNRPVFRGLGELGKTRDPFVQGP